MQPFVVNRHGRLVFPSNFQPDLDFSVIETEEQLDRVIRPDFETKAPTGTDIMNRVAAGGYVSRYELMRDVALNLFWVNRFAQAGRDTEDIGAVLFCSCTSSRLIPSASTWLTGQLGMQQTHASVDLIAACAGLPYGLSEAVRLLQEVDRPVLLVCAEKFSDKIGTVRPSRMIFGDGASAILIGPAPVGERGDIDLLQPYAGGPVTQVNSITWPNPVFDNNITVHGPEVKELAGRYLAQMIQELTALADTTGKADTAWDTGELVVPHRPGHRRPHPPTRAGADHRLPRPTSRPTSPGDRPRPRVGRHRHSVRGLSMSSAAMNPRIPA
jgi:hypothetical protein